jgi:protein-S-isoprenylcysteine O-methyltransferase Ste14
MIQQKTQPPAPAGSPDSQLLRTLRNPAVDKAFAITACLPYLFLIYLYVRTHQLDLAHIAMIIHMLVQVTTMFARRTPVRVTFNPLYWALAFVATYWPFLSVGLTTPGRAIAPSWLIDTAGISSLAILLYARVSLGRNIGFVPAQRSLVTDGAYAHVRHPIYTGIFVAYFCTALSSFSWRNLLPYALGVGLFMVKSLVEERFLAADPQYRHYMQQTRWRWLPGVA